MLVLLGHFFKIHLPWPCIFAVVMYKKISFFPLDKLPVGRTMVQLVPPAFGSGDDALFEFLEHLQNPLSMTAIPLCVKSCFNVGIWGWTCAVDKD